MTRAPATAAAQVTYPAQENGDASITGWRIDTMSEPEATEYDALPEPIRASIGRREWAWLSDAEKATLVQRECEPDE